MNSEIPEDFPEPKSTGNYMVPTLGISEGTFLFSYLGVFLSYITPHDLPIELWRDVFNSRISIFNMFIEALKLEIGFICLLILFFLISIIPLTLLMSWCFKKKTVEPALINGIDRIPSVDSLMTLDASIENASIQFRRRFLQFVLQVLIIFLVVGITAIFITNEEVSIAIDKTPGVVRASLKDIQIFLKDAHRQITVSVQDGMGTAVNRIKYDLDNIDMILGDPIKRDIEFHTQIELSFDSIFAICSANTQIVERAQLIQNAINDAMILTQDAFTKIAELQTQLTILQSQCSIRDRPLCETLKLKNLNDNGILEVFEKLQNDRNLRKLLTIGEPEINGFNQNLSIEQLSAKSILKTFPLSIKQSTSRTTTEIIKYASYMRDATETSSKMLTSTIRKLLDNVDRVWNVAAPVLDNFDITSYYVWILGLSGAITILLITVLIVTGLCYGYCHSEQKAGFSYVVAAVFIAICSLGLGILTGFLMILGAHGEIFMCRSFYDEPNYHVLHELFDNPGFLYLNKPINTFLGELLRPPGINQNFAIANASLTHAINACKHNNASFNVFQLEGLMNVSKVTDYNEYSELGDAVDRITIQCKPFISLTLELQTILKQMIVNGNVNLTEHRISLSNPTPEKDLSTFVDQMQRVSLQIQDVATSSRMATLGNRAKRLQNTLLQPLEHVKDNIIFHLTALEVERDPWIKQVNQSLLHLKTAQMFLNQDAEALCLNKTNMYKQRIKNHLWAVKHHLVSILDERIATCRPLFDVFDANRLLLCHKIIDPLNGLWFSSLYCLILWAMTMPIILALATIYGHVKVESRIRHTNSHQYGTPTDNLIISEQSNWRASNSQIATDIDRSNW